MWTVKEAEDFWKSIVVERDKEIERIEVKLAKIESIVESEVITKGESFDKIAKVVTSD